MARSSERTNREARKLLLGLQEKEDRKAKSSSSRGSKGRSKGQPGWREALVGILLAVLATFALQRLGLIGMVPVLRGDHAIGVAAVVGLLLGISRVRALLWVGAGVAAAGLLVVGYTPLVHPLIRECVRRDPLRPVEAVVVLGSDIFPDGQMSDAAQIRLLRGYEVIRQGYAKRLVITRLQPPKRSYQPPISAQFDRLGFDIPLEEVGPVRNTHDEALKVSELAQDRGWKQIILVSDASHLRRAGAVFEKTGLKVMCTPCLDRRYDLETLSTPGERWDAFRDWLWEYIGYHTYRRNGWI